MSLKSKLSLSAVVATALVLVPALAFAQNVTSAASNQFDANSWLAAASGFAIGIAALGGYLIGRLMGGNTYVYPRDRH